MQRDPVTVGSGVVLALLKKTQGCADCVFTTAGASQPDLTAGLTAAFPPLKMYGADWQGNSPLRVKLDHTIMDCCNKINRQVSFTEKELQPDQDGIWRCGFERNRHMASEILLSNHIVHRLDSTSDIFPSKAFGTPNYLVTDSITDEFYGTLVMEKLKTLGLEVHKLVIPSSGEHEDQTGDSSTEKFKTMEQLQTLIDTILKKGITKNSTIISLGGGVVNNMCGFLASMLYRGVPLIHITTTCMGMLDAAIDFKQAVNHCCGKNLLGAYYPASKIIIDPTLLATQSARAIRNGLAEAIKHGLCHSPDLLDFILSGAEDVKDAEYLEKLIKMTVALKAPTLTHYDKSNFNEMCPQYGHSVGHACEFLGFKSSGVALLHGEAVAIGCCVSAEISKLLGFCDQECVDAHYEAFSRAGLPTFAPDNQSANEILHQMVYDKHYEHKKATMGLVTAVGTMAHKDGNFSFEIDDEVVLAAIKINKTRNFSANNGIAIDVPATEDN